MNDLKHTPFTLKTLIIAASALLAGAAAEAEEAGDAEAGRKVFRKCSACHQVGDSARNRSGPVLNNILQAKAAGVADFKYSPAMRRAADDGLHWTADTLDAFLKDPRDYIPKTRMTFAGLRDAQDRADVIAYLASFSGDQMAARVDAGFEVAPEILALEGDAEYGEYLSSECKTCHQSDGDNDGIPSIVGWESDTFVTAMHAYRGGHREHPVMQMIAGRLNDEEIAALAAYFKDLGN